MRSRRAKVRVIYNGVDISRDISSSLLSFSFVDNSEGKADDLQIKVHDREGLWKGNLPQKGSIVKAYIELENWHGDDDKGELFCGSFSLDDITVSGPPDVVSLKCVSAMMDSSIRREKKTRAWENVSLSGIAKDMSDSAGVELFYESPTDPHYERRDQRETSDIAFLRGLCDSYGLALKISDRKIVIFDSATYEKNTSIAVLSKKMIKSYSFSTKTVDVYRACTVKYHDSKMKEIQSYTYEADPPIAVGQTLQIRRRVESLAEAVTLAKKELRGKNRHECTGSLNLIGDVRLSAGLNVDLVGLGSFDGKYHIESATHNIGGGYSTSLQLRRVLDY